MALRDWIERMPGAEVVRPPRCPDCDAPSRPVGEPLGLWGHGVREREVLGPLSALGKPEARVIKLRRYLCRICKAVCTVGPAELVPGRRYSGPAILLALALWSHAGQGAREVRCIVSPYQVIGPTAAAGWAALRRFVRSGPWPATAGATWRERGRHLVSALLRCSPLDPALASIPERAFAAFAHLPRGPSP